MKPDACQLALTASVHEAYRRQDDARRAKLHEAAVARRRKAKRGGRR